MSRRALHQAGAGSAKALRSERGSMRPRSTEEASAAVAEGEGRARRPRARRVRKGLAGHAVDFGFHYT